MRPRKRGKNNELLHYALESREDVSENLTARRICLMF
jgi:hypothetical protein